MKEKVVPAIVAATGPRSLADLATRPANPKTVAFRRQTSDGWRDVTAAEFAREVTALAAGFRAAGIGVGDVVGIMSRTRYEWTLCDFALWACGAIPVPIYETSSVDQIEWIVRDAQAVAVIVETTDHAAEVTKAEVSLRATWIIDAGDLDTLSASGGDVDDLDEARQSIDRTSLATIIYTSGTTGRPKGVELSHGNFLDLVENTTALLPDIVSAPGASTIIFLPLAHVFARFVEVLCVNSGAAIGHCPDVADLSDALQSFQPTFVLAVPRVFEKVFNAAETNAAAAGRSAIFTRAVDTAISYSRAQQDGKVAIGLSLKHRLFDALVYRKLRAALGGQMAYAVSGGAPLGERLGHFFRGVGVTILEGFGLTETTAPITVNRPDALRIGTVGQPLPGCSVRIADDGEVLLAGVGTFTEYHNNPDATSAAIEDGWFRSGDLGSLDEDGFLTITGRKKEIIVTAGGKNVAPAVLEDQVRADPIVSQCIVVGDARPFVAALVTLDADALPAWGANHGAPDLTDDSARDNPAVHAEVQRAIDEANKSVSKAESIRSFVILPGDFTIDNGYLTPSLKLKRNLVLRDFSHDIDQLYAKPRT